MVNKHQLPDCQTEALRIRYVVPPANANYQHNCWQTTRRQHPGNVNKQTTNNVKEHQQQRLLVQQRTTQPSKKCVR